MSLAGQAAHRFALAQQIAHLHPAARQFIPERTQVCDCAPDALLVHLADGSQRGHGAAVSRDHKWKRQLLERAAEVFDAGPRSDPVNLAPLHAKIGQLALENDFLESALTKAGLLSAKP